MSQSKQYARSSYAQRRKRGPGKIILVIALIVIVVAIVAGVLFSMQSCDDQTGTVRQGEEIQVTIPSGASTDDIAKILVDKGIIGSSAKFTKRVKELKQASSLQSGTYHLKGGDSVDNIIKILTTGQTGRQLVIPEGLNLRQIASRVEQASEVSADEFYALTQRASDYVADYPFLDGVYNDSMEGFLYPDTYRIDPAATADDIIRMMLDQFESQFATVDMSYAASKNLTPYDIVTLASIVEKEFKVEADKAPIAAVFYNRLHERIPLGSDVTTYYAVGKEMTEPLTKEDLASDSPYNTRNPSYYGLPAGPICSPSVSTLKAAANPSQDTYLYFFYSNKEGKTMFFDNDSDFSQAWGTYGD